MKLSSIGPVTAVEGLDPERSEPAVQSQEIAAPHASQLETEADKKPKVDHLALLIEEAKKRATKRKQRGHSRLRQIVLTAYKYVMDYEKFLAERGENLDKSA